MKTRFGPGFRGFAGEALSWDHRGVAVEVRLHREPCNEIGTTVLDELEELAVYLQDGAGGARALILHSEVRRGFSAGADLRELYDGLVTRRDRVDRLTERLPGSLEAGARRLAERVVVRRVRAFLDRIHAAFDTLDTAPITTIAAVHGVCFGGGFELALACDLIVADKTARFCFPELRLGLVPGFGGIPRLERDVGGAVIRDLLLTGRSIRASRAHEVGLVSQLVARGEALEVARRVADQAARFDRATTAAAKAYAKRVPRRRLEEEKDTFCQLITSEAVFDALSRFVEDDGPMPWLPR